MYIRTAYNARNFISDIGTEKNNNNNDKQYTQVQWKAVCASIVSEDYKPGRGTIGTREYIYIITLQYFYSVMTERVFVRRTTNDMCPSIHAQRATAIYFTVIARDSLIGGRRYRAHEKSVAVGE